MNIALIGLGEVGRIFAEDVPAYVTVSAFDTAAGDPQRPAHTNASELGIITSATAADAVQEAAVIISAVTASQDLIAAESVVNGIRQGAFFFDLNSASPGQKQQAAAVIEAAGGRYVEAALMSPIGPRRLASPFLLGGPHTAAFLDVANSIGVSSASTFSDCVGVAAATKLCRSVIVKGLESLFGESLTAARHYGVEREVIDSLNNILPQADWEEVAGYFVSRSLQHGVRRSEEMREAARTVEEAGLTPRMAAPRQTMNSGCRSSAWHSILMI